MTPADLELCRDIAELEKRELGKGKNEGWFYDGGAGLKPFHVYLTDPDEQCRMQEKIIEEYGSIHIYTEFLGEYRDRKVIAVRMGDKKGEENTYIGKNTPVAIAEAYKATLDKQRAENEPETEER